MPDYKQGKIYAIRSHQTDQIYIGSTTNPLHKRLYDHRSLFKTNKWYISSHEILKYDDNYIELIEMFPCNSKMELCKREGEIIRETENCVNKQIAGRTKKEWEEEYKDRNNQKKKQYLEENKERVKKYQNDYWLKNKDKMTEKMKVYSELNKENIKKWKKNYYELNKEKLDKKAKKKYYANVDV